MSSSQSETHNSLAGGKNFWTETIVRWTRGMAANVYVQPAPDENEILAQIHRGDMVQVRTDVRRETWVPCRTGHVIGWLNTQDVKLIRTGTAPLRQTVTIEMPKAPSEEDEEKKRKVNLIQRLIKFFK